MSLEGQPKLTIAVRCRNVFLVYWCRCFWSRHLWGQTLKETQRERQEKNKHSCELAVP